MMKMRIVTRILNREVRKWGGKIAIVALIFVLLYGFFCWLPKLLPCLLSDMFQVSSATLTEYGQMGDSYGIFNALFSCLAFFGVLLTIFFQIRENKRRTVAEQFYQMLDVQQKVIDEINVSQVRRVKKGETVNIQKGRKAFVEFKIQIKYLMKDIREIIDDGGFELSAVDVADISYAVFFYGSAESWKPFMLEYLKDYHDAERLVDAIIQKLDANKRFVLTRPNQNYLSVYFRNMYNAIKLIDSCTLFKQNEKKDYVKILRAQLSNAELYVLFFNVISRFGMKWINNDYIDKYQLIQNLPMKYCDGYNPKDFFPNVKFEGEDTCLSPFKNTVVPRNEND